jgi:uncharacterized integral membrane protein
MRLLRLLRYLVIVLLAVVLVVVAMANRDPVSLHLLPGDLADYAGFSATAKIPLFLVIFAAAAAGLVIGFVWEWLREGKHRKTASRGQRQVTALSREVARLRDKDARPKDEVLALLDSPQKTRAR